MRHLVPGAVAVAAAALAFPAPALAGPHQVFVEADLLWTFGGTRHFGLGLGGHYSYVVGPDVWCPDVGAFARLRWTRLAYLSATVGPRIGIADAEHYGGGGYSPILGANVDAGWTWRTKGGSGLLVGGGAYLFVGQLRVDALVWTRENGPMRPGGELPIPGWAGPGKHDVTLSLGGQMWTMPQYYLLLTEQDADVSAPPPDPITTTGPE